MRKIWIILSLAVLLVAGIGSRNALASGPSCKGISCRGIWPDDTNCAGSHAYSVQGAHYANGNWGRIYIELRYSWYCTSNWSRVSAVRTQYWHGWPNYLYAYAHEQWNNYTEDYGKTYTPYVGRGAAVFTRMVDGYDVVQACGGMKNRAYNSWYSPWSCYEG